MKHKEYEDINLKDGRKATILEVYPERHCYIVEITSSEEFDQDVITDEDILEERA